MSDPRKIIPNLEDRNLRVDFRVSQFDVLLDQKGYDVLWSQMTLCPCRKDLTTQPNTNCLSCGGNGFLFVSSQVIKAVMTNAMLQKNFHQQWSEILQGTLNVTVSPWNKLGWYDSIQVVNARTVFSEVKPLMHNETDDTYYIRLHYLATSIINVFKVVEGDTPSALLVEAEDITGSAVLTGNPVLYFRSDLGLEVGQNVSVRYEYRPEYLIIDLLNDFRNTFTEIKSVVPKSEEMPLRALAKRRHLVLGNGVVPNVQ
jgi:hypothetical protein